MKRVRVFLCVDVDLEGLPDEYKQAIEKYTNFDPEILCMPWPEHLIVTIGQKMFAGALPIGLDELEVRSIEYFISSDEILVEVSIEAGGTTSEDLTARDVLVCFASLGFVFFGSWDKPIKEILLEAGLNVEF